MPYQDRTGPQGLGPQTGRRLGPCARLASYGTGRRLRQRIPADSLEMLETEERLLQDTLDRVREEKEKINNKK